MSLMAFTVFLGVVFANFLFEACTKRGWGDAFKISIFQGCALGALVLAEYVLR
jgi:hypothetical protein